MGLLQILVGKNPNEPVLGRASIGAILALLVAFGVQLTADQTTALTEALTFILPAITAIVAATARSKVSPVQGRKSD